MLDGKRVLVIEEQFLIALDIQRILEDAKAAQTLFARSVREAAELAGRWAGFDLAVVALPRSDANGLALVRGLISAGVKVVISSGDSSYRRGVPELPNVPVVIKPFDAQELVAACMWAVDPASPPVKGERV